MHAPQDTTVRLPSSTSSAIFHRTRTTNASVLFTQNGVLPGEMPGVTRYPHPKSDKCLKSKAPASGVPARPRVLFLTTNTIQQSSQLDEVKCTPPARHANTSKGWRACLAFLGAYRGHVTQPSHEVGRVRQSHQDSSTDSLHSRPTRGHKKSEITTGF